MASSAHVDNGLLLARVAYRESDLILTFFTEALGRVSALARGARNSRKRFGGVLEPMHTLRLHLDARPGELMLLREASLAVPRTRLLTRLDALETAGRALHWIRQAARQTTPEPSLYRGVNALLDHLNSDRPPEGRERLFLAEFGLLMLTSLGFGIEFRHCVRCGKECARERAALIDARRGGLVCRACGGASKRLEAARRGRLASAADGASEVLEATDADDALELVEQALQSHLGLLRT